MLSISVNNLSLEVYTSHKTLFQKFSGCRAGILTNQSAFGYQGMYHFQYYKKFFPIEFLFFPEHGLFAELQDQVSGNCLQYNIDGIQVVNLYGDNEGSLVPQDQYLQNLDVVIIDIRDVGARYYTFLTSAFYLVKKTAEINSRLGKNIQIIVIDSPNPAGRAVEGSPLDAKFESFVGVASVFHRHGLTPAELMHYYLLQFKLNLSMHVLKAGDIYRARDLEQFWIPPSPNIPALSTTAVYSGQCLLEGTEISEGRGTTRPFEMFGAPYLDIENKAYLDELQQYQKEAFMLRPLKFIPVFHKYAGIVCNGFHLILRQKSAFHSLLFTLHFIKTTKKYFPAEFRYKTGPYEFKSDLSAIELLCGDDKILDFLNDSIGYAELQDYFRQKEQEWESASSELLLYPKIPADV